MTDTVLRVEPYEGTEDYIFISYSHRDAPVVIPLLRRLKAEGYRFWYDEGIDPGSEWPEAIATHLSSCRLCIAFISTSSLASQNCRREINFALSKEKEFLSVFLEPVEMSPGMEMQISSYQSIFKFRYPDEEQFLQKLFGVGLLDSCKKQTGTATSAEPDRPETPPTQPTCTYTQTVTQTPPSKPAATAKKGPGQVILTILIIVAALALLTAGAFGIIAAIVLILFLVRRLSTKRVAIGTTVYQDKASVRISNAAVSPEQLRTLASFKRCRLLYLTNCALENDALRELAAMRRLALLSLVNCRGVGNLYCVNNIPTLRTLIVSGCGLTDDKLTGVHGTQLVNLDLSYNALTRVPELVNPFGLKGLSLVGNKLTDLTPLAHLASLNKLDVRGTGVSITSLPGWKATNNAGVFTR